MTCKNTPGKPGRQAWASGSYGHPNAFLSVTGAGQVQLLDGTSVVQQKP